MINDKIEIVVLESNGPQVRVGINAPQSVRVLRRELRTQDENENQTAVECSSSSRKTIAAIH